MSSTYCGPFLEENVVSGRADKSIYMEDQSYDGQNQCTEQALDSCITVKTRYTVSDSTEVLLYPLASNTSSHTEGITCFNLFLLTNNLPLLTQNETLGSLLNYLQNLSFLQPIKISINQYQTESHIYTNIDDSLLPNHILLLPEKFHKFYNIPIRTILKIPYIDPNTLL